MQFFIPRTSADNTEVYYTGIRSFLANEWGYALTPRRIERLSYRNKDQRLEAVVGKRFGVNHDLLFAIFETKDAYLVCTPAHGISGLPPTVIKRKDVVEVIEFDAAQAQQAV